MENEKVENEPEKETNTPDVNELLERVQQLETRPITFQVKTPTHIRLPSFEGRGFSDWLQKWRNYVSESDDDEEAQLRKLRSSLRAVPKEIADGHDTVDDILRSLQEIFGVSSTQDDKLADFIKMKNDPKETPTNFFGRLWAALLDLNTPEVFSVVDFRRKLYHQFMTGVGDRILAVELRAEFGLPGVDAPEPENVLRRLKHMEPACSQSSRAMSVHSNSSVESSGNIIDYERLADLVAQRLRPRFRSESKSFSLENKLCYKCGQYGHYQRQCRKPANPKLVSERRSQLNG